MQEVVIVHLLKKGFGLQVAQGQVGGVLIKWQVESHWEEGSPLEVPSSHSSPGSTCPSPHLGGASLQILQSVVQLLPLPPFL